MQDVLLSSINHVLMGLPAFAAALLLAAFARWIFGRTSVFRIDEELVDRDNPAAGVAFAGYIAGVAIAISGAVYPANEVALLSAVLTVIVFGAIAALLMRLSLWINDHAILYRFSIAKELVKDRNAGTGFVVAGSSIATGFMLRGVLSGFSASVWMALRDIAIYFVVGQAVLVAGGWVYTRFAGYDVQKEIGDHDNVAAGISFGGYLVALGYITSTALEGASSQWASEIVTSLVLAVFGTIFLVLVRVLVDVLLLPKSPLAKEVAVDRNSAAGAVAAAAFVLVAVLFSASVQPDRAAVPALVDHAPLEAPAALPGTSGGGNLP